MTQGAWGVTDVTDTERVYGAVSSDFAEVALNKVAAMKSEPTNELSFEKITAARWFSATDTDDIESRVRMNTPKMILQ